MEIEYNQKENIGPHNVRCNPHSYNKYALTKYISEFYCYVGKKKIIPEPFDIELALDALKGWGYNEEGISASRNFLNSLEPEKDKLRDSANKLYYFGSSLAKKIKGTFTSVLNDALKNAGFKLITNRTDSSKLVEFEDAKPDMFHSYYFDSNSKGLLWISTPAWRYIFDESLPDSTLHTTEQINQLQLTKEINQYFEINWDYPKKEWRNKEFTETFTKLYGEKKLRISDQDIKWL